MKPRIKFGLALSLGILVVAIEAVVLLSLGIFYLRHFGAEVDRRLDESLRKPSLLVSQGALSTDAFGQRDTLRSLVGPALDDAMVVSADGVILVALEPGRVGHRWDELSGVKNEWLRRAVTGGFNEKFLIGTNSFLTRIAPVASMSGEAPVLFDYVRIRTTENERELTSLRLRLIGGSVVAIAATTVALLLAVNFLVTRRLRRIAGTVEQVTAGNYDTSLGRSRMNDEIGFLQAGFDTMTGRLRQAFGGLRNAVRELEIAEQKYRVHVENADQSILVVQDGKFAFANAKCHQMLGFPPDTLISRPMLDFIHPDDRPLISERYSMRMRGEAPPSRYEFRMFSATRSAVWVELNVVVIDWKGAPATLNFLSDITERRRAEAERGKLQEQLIQAQKMESVGRLAGGVAHDFNNMLQAILGNTALAMEEAPPGGSLRESLEEIQQSAQRSADLTRQLLAFARKQTIAPKVLDLNDTIAGMLKLLRRLIGEHIKLVWLPGTSLWPVRIDPSQLDQILANLCINARDAIRDSGKLTIETQDMTLDDTYASTHPECLPGDYVLLTVSDDGHGMDAEVLSRVFEPFFTTKELGKGTGLGLATVFGIVKQNKGLINVYSEPGRGTTFKICLPRVEATTNQEPSIARPAAPVTETVLLVEDEEQILKLGRKILSQRGYTVLTASTPQRALERKLH